MPTINERLGAAAKEIREAAGVSIEDMAIHLGCEVRTVEQLESHEGCWGFFILEGYREKCHVDPYHVAFPDPKSQEIERLLRKRQWAGLGEVRGYGWPTCLECRGFRPPSPGTAKGIHLQLGDFVTGHRPNCKWKALFPEVTS